MKVVKNPIGKAIGLMFASNEKIARGICLANKKESRCGITTIFCTQSLEMIFVNSKNVVVDKVILRPWVLSYVPKKPYKYVIESKVSSLNYIYIGDKVNLMFF